MSASLRATKASITLPTVLGGRQPLLTLRTHFRFRDHDGTGPFEVGRPMAEKLAVAIRLIHGKRESL